MAREERTLEVTLISATDLKKVKKFGREQKNYVSAYVYPARRQTTGADPYGGVNPTWNTTLKVACYESDLFPAAASSSSPPSTRELTLEIYSHGGGVFHTADKLVGTVIVPLQQVVSAAQAGGAMPPFNVHLPSDSGGVEGSLNLKVNLGSKRELGEYEDLTAAPLSAYHDQGFRTSSYNLQGQSSSGDHPTNGCTPSANHQGQSSSGNYPQTSDHTPSEKPTTTEGGKDTVTGYPAPGYTFAPLGQLPNGERQEEHWSGTNEHGPYVASSPEAADQHNTIVDRIVQRRQKRRERRKQRTPEEKIRRAGLIALHIVTGGLIRLVL